MRGKTWVWMVCLLLFPAVEVLTVLSWWLLISVGSRICQLPFFGNACIYGLIILFATPRISLMYYVGLVLGYIVIWKIRKGTIQPLTFLYLGAAAFVLSIIHIFFPPSFISELMPLF